MSILVFLGPTLPVSEARARLDATYLPPASMGDVLRAVEASPKVIAIVDGLFENVPAVWHKEVLYALSKGVRVFGASSMGALRAAELHAFGMEGIGEIFQAFATGALEDDDEVAVAHAAAEHGYRALSEPMVDVRATVKAAVESGCLDEGAARAVLRAAKGMFYADRRWPAIVAAAAREGLSAEGARAVESFVREGKVARKREDAVAMVRAMGDRFARPVAPFQADFAFERTDAWELIRQKAEATPLPGAAGEAVSASHGELLRALAERGCLHEALQGALARALSLEVAARQGRRVEGQALSEAVESFRRARGLFTPDAMARWLADNDVRDPDRFLRAEALVAWAVERTAPETLRHLADHLRSTGQYAELRAGQSGAG